MLEFMNESAGDILGVRGRGKLTADDYTHVLVPRLESILKRFDKVRVLLYVDETFQGWDLGGASANTCLDVRHRTDFQKVAIVGAPVWEEWCAKLASLLINGEIKTFKTDQLQIAWEWLRA